MFEEAIQIGFVEVSPFAKSGVVEVPPFEKSRVVELLSGMQIGGCRGASLRKIEGCRVAFWHADRGASRCLHSQNRGLSSCFLPCRLGGVEANKLHKSGFSELVKGQTANFDINALFICLFFAYFICKAYNYLKRSFFICVSEKKIKCFSGFTRIKYCKSE